MDKSNLVEGMDFNGDHDLSFCDGCVYGKQHCMMYFEFSLGGFSCKRNVWACAHEPMCSHGNIS